MKYYFKILYYTFFPSHLLICLHGSYSDIIIEREVLMQKYIHLVQIVETEKVAANQLRTQLEDQDTEIERLKAEVGLLDLRHFTLGHQIVECSEERERERGHPTQPQT